jgi:RNA polymerase sigma-70 factor (ECF subfamily)
MHRHPDRQLTVDHLLQEAAALRSLGRRLLDAAAAEDLVQETYLAALRGRSPNGAVGAWLHGIAHKLALLMRRRNSRRQQREQAAARPASGPSAADAAASAELMQRIAAAVQGLPEVYRTAVVLRFWHDLPPRRIAHELQVSVHTVRSRLQRALAMLRERLDAAAGSRTAWLAPLDCLLQTPAAVVAATGVFAPLFAGVTSMGTKLQFGAVAVVALAAGWGITQWGQEAVTPPPLDAGGGAVLAAVAAPGAPQDAPARQLVGAEPTHLTGRCVAAETGAPLPGCRVVLLPDRSPGERAATPPTATTDQEGRFSLSVHGGVGLGHRLLFGMAERVLDGRSFASLPRGEVEVGEVALSLGAMVYGTVHTADGQPVAELRLECRLLGAPDTAPDPSGGGVKVLFSSAGGVLQQDEFAFGPGHWRLLATAEDHELVSPREFDVLPGQRRIDLDVLVVALADLPAIGGVLVDEAGVPVGGVTVHAGDSANWARSAADGAFVVYRRTGEDEPVRLSLGSSAACTLRDPQAVYAWGSQRQRVTVQRPAGVAIQVVNAATGAVVTKFGVRLQPLTEGSWRWLPRSDIAERPNGLLQLKDVKPARYRIVAFPGDPELAPSDPIECELGSAGALLQLRCEPAGWLTLLVQDAAGEPVAGAYVDLVRREGEGELTEASFVGTEDYVAQFGIQNRFVALSSGRTNERGEIVLRGPSRGYLGLRARGTFVTRLLGPVVLGGPDRRIVMQIERGATLAGSLAPASLLAELRPTTVSPLLDGNEHLDARKKLWPTLQLRASDPRRLLPRNTMRDELGFPIAADGTFRIEGIPPGDWTLELLCAIDGRPQLPSLGQVASLREGERRQVEFSLAGLAPGELRAVVLRDGAPWPNAQIHCNGGWSRTDARGRLKLRARPGSYWPEADIGEGHDRYLYCTEVVVQPGEVTSVTLDFVRRKVRIHVLDADGAPVPKRAFQIVGFSRTFETDAEGWFLLDPAPPWPCRLTYYEGWLDRAAVERLAKEDATAWTRLRRTAEPLPMPLDRLSADLELRLPR